MEKRAWCKVKGSESKSNLAYAGATIPGVLNMQKVRSLHMPVLSLSVLKVVFLISNHFFKFGCFSRYHSHFLEKNEFDFLVQNLILNSLAQFLNPKCERQKSWCDIFFLPCFHF